MTAPLNNSAGQVADAAQANNIARIFDRALWASVTDIQDLEEVPASIERGGRPAGLGFDAPHVGRGGLQLVPAGGMPVTLSARCAAETLAGLGTRASGNGQVVSHAPRMERGAEHGEQVEASEIER